MGSYQRTLELAKIIAPEGYGKGLPVLLPYGLAIMRRMSTLFGESMAPNASVLMHDPTLLTDARQYDEEVEAFGGYDNVYRIADLGAGGMVVRPDCAVANLRLLIQSLQTGGPNSILAMFQGARSIKGPTIPLFRDRSIWPFLQFNCIVPVGDRKRVTNQLLDRLSDFFSQLGIPSVIVAMGPWKDYSPELYNVITWMPDGTPTIIAMAFVVGDTYHKLSGLSDEVVAFDVGLTEKVVSMLIMQRAENESVNLPSSITPIQVLVGADKRDGPGGLDHADLKELRVSWNEDDGLRWWQRARRKGIPVIISRQRRGWRRFSKIDGWRDLGAAGDINKVIALSDQQQLSAVRRRLASGISTSLHRNEDNPNSMQKTVPVVRMAALNADFGDAFILPDRAFY